MLKRCLVLLVLLVSSPAAAEESPIMKALFERNGESFVPPATNKPLQALLASKPKLTFFEACGVGDAGVVARELARDPKLATTWNGFGWSALHLGAFSGSADVVRLLLDRGADINARARTAFKNTPLQVAMLPGQLATAKVLLERGADPLVRQAKGFTPLHEAAFDGRRDLVDLLLAAGAEIDSRTDDGRTAVTEARRGKHPAIADYLVSRGGHGAEPRGDVTKSPEQ